MMMTMLPSIETNIDLLEFNKEKLIILFYYVVSKLKYIANRIIKLTLVFMG
jgi:hypothetical protein